MGSDRHLLASLIALALLAGPWAAPLHAQGLHPGGSVLIEAQPWEEAQKLFRTDVHWLGGDGASSVDLGDERVLWLFGDSFVNPAGSRSRRDAALVRNSVAIQKGYAPATAKMTFSWRTLGNRPRSFFHEEGTEWFWPGSGIRIRDVLLLFLMRVRRTDNALGFEPSGWKAVLVPNPDSPPTLWGMVNPRVPKTGRILVGSSSVVIADGFLYAFGTDGKDQSVYTVRWPLADAAGGTLLAPQWWVGPDRGWTGALAPGHRPVPVFTGGQAEFTVHFETDLKGFIQVQTLSLADPCLAARFTGGISLPWSVPECFFQPPERAVRGLLIYAGKAHKVFEGADLAFTYAVNTMDVERLMSDMEIYYPVVLKGSFTVKPQERAGEDHAPQVPGASQGH
jgi:hypothetical protein